MLVGDMSDGGHVWWGMWKKLYHLISLIPPPSSNKNNDPLIIAVVLHLIAWKVQIDCWFVIQDTRHQSKPNKRLIKPECYYLYTNCAIVIANLIALIIVDGCNTETMRVPSPHQDQGLKGGGGHCQSTSRLKWEEEVLSVSALYIGLVIKEMCFCHFWLTKYMFVAQFSPQIYDF